MQGNKTKKEKTRSSKFVFLYSKKKEGDVVYLDAVVDWVRNTV